MRSKAARNIHRSQTNHTITCGNPPGNASEKLPRSPSPVGACAHEARVAEPVKAKHYSQAKDFVGHTHLTAARGRRWRCTPMHACMHACTSVANSSERASTGCMEKVSWSGWLAEAGIAGCCCVDEGTERIPTQTCTLHGTRGSAGHTLALLALHPLCPVGATRWLHVAQVRNARHAPNQRRE